MSKIITVGRIGSSYGVKGWLKLFSYTQPGDNILHYPQWYIQMRDEWQLVDMKTLETHLDASGHIRIKLPDCDSPEAAHIYTQAYIGVSRDQLPDLTLGDYYWSDLEGLNVVNTEGVDFGQVDHLISTGSNDVLVIKGDRERLVPYIKDAIIDVSLENKKIIVDWDADF